MTEHIELCQGCGSKIWVRGCTCKHIESLQSQIERLKKENVSLRNQRDDALNLHKDLWQRARDEQMKKRHGR